MASAQVAHGPPVEEVDVDDVEVDVEVDVEDVDVEDVDVEDVDVDVEADVEDVDVEDPLLDELGLSSPGSTTVTSPPHASSSEVSTTVSVQALSKVISADIMSLAGSADQLASETPPVARSPCHAGLAARVLRVARCRGASRLIGFG